MKLLIKHIKIRNMINRIEKGILRLLQHTILLLKAFWAS